MTGMTPDGFAGRVVNAARFVTHQAQLRALQRALTIFRQTGQRVFEFDMGGIIGEGFLKGGTTYAQTTTVLAVFKAGKLLTLYPKL
jgi:filamentous hemagglutinin